MKWFSIGVYIFLYSRLTRPAWVWHNLCYKKGIQSVPIRLLCLFRFSMKGKEIKNLLDIRVLQKIAMKVIYLWKKPKPGVG